MLYQDFFESITLELKALKDRVQHFIGSKHWQTAGEWKESVLRNILRRHLPETVKVGRGFVVADTAVSSQVDILLYGSDSPLLYQEGDLVFVGPEAVRGIVEVKTGLEPATLEDDLAKLANNVEFVRSNTCFARPFYGLFAYEDRNVSSESLARALQKVAAGIDNRIIPCVSLGENGFVRYLDFGPEDRINPLGAWRSYSLPRTAPAFFIANLIGTICNKGPIEWVETARFPFPDIEPHQCGDIRFCPKNQSPQG